MVSRNFFRFNTTNIISAETDNEDILDEAVEWCDRYELLFSRVDPASELFRLNSAEGRPTAVDAELAAFIETALSYCREVDGLFDVTMGSATQLWNFKDCMIPARDDVAAALRHVDYRGVIVNDAVVTLRDPLACVDLGGIAKGYIATASSRCCANAAWNTLWSTSAATWPSWAASPMEHRGAWASAVPFPPARCRCLIRSPSWPCAMARP